MDFLCSVHSSHFLQTLARAAPNPPWSVGGLGTIKPELKTQAANKALNQKSALCS